jgi:hypothetical protein
MVRRFDEERLSAMNRVLASGAAGIRSTTGSSILTIGSATFEKRWKDLSDVESKYSRFLEPHELIAILDLEVLLRRLAGSINARNTLSGNTNPLAQALVPVYEDRVFSRLDEAATLIVKIKKEMFQ